MKKCKNCEHEEDPDEDFRVVQENGLCVGCNEPQRIECPACLRTTLEYGGGSHRKHLKTPTNESAHSSWMFVCFGDGCDYETDIIFPYPGISFDGDMNFEDCEIHDHVKATFWGECRECLVMEYCDDEDVKAEVKKREVAIHGLT